MSVGREAGVGGRQVVVVVMASNQEPGPAAAVRGILGDGVPVVAGGRGGCGRLQHAAVLFQDVTADVVVIIVVVVIRVAAVA